jgi:acid phosphatase
MSLCALSALTPGSAQAPEGCYPIPTPPPVDFSHPPNLDLIKSELLYYRCTQYDTDVTAALADAQQWVKARAPQVMNPAIVLDIDETSLSNWTRIYKDDFAYFANGPCRLDSKGDPCGDLAWQASEQAPALEPTLKLYDLARCSDVPLPCQRVEVFFVTGRHVNSDNINGKTPTEWTLGNLDKAGYNNVNPDHLYMRPADSTGPVASYKTNARTDIEKRFGVAIIANVGDQQSDLAGGHAERTFKVPNPFYYIP